MSVGNDGSWSYEVGSCQAHKEGSLQNKIILKERSCLLKRKKKPRDVGTHLCLFLCMSVLSSHWQVYHLFALFHRGQKRACDPLELGSQTVVKDCGC